MTSKKTEELPLVGSTDAAEIGRLGAAIIHVAVPNAANDDFNSRGLRVSALFAAPDLVSVADFGAVGDGVTDDSAAFQAALDSGAKCVLIPFTVAGYKVKGLLITANTALIARQYVKIIANDTFATIGELGADVKAVNVQIANLNIDMRGAVNPASAAFVFRAASGANRTRQWDVSIENVNVIGAYCTAKQDADTPLSYMLQCYFTRVNSFFPRGTSWSFPNLQGFVMFWSCQVDWTGDVDRTLPMVGEVVATAFVADYPAFLLGGNTRSAGVQMHWCAVSSNGLSDTALGHGFVLRNISAATLMNCEADGVTGIGFKIGDAAFADADPELLSISHLIMNDCVAFSHGENGFQFDKVASAQIKNMRSVGRKGLATGNANQIGVQINSSHDMVIDGTVILNSRDRGLSISDSFIITASPVRVRNCAGKAALLVNTSDCILPMNLKACADGLYLTGACTDNSFPGLNSRGHTVGSGVTFDGVGVGRNIVSNVALIGNAEYGRKDINGASANLLAGGSIVANTLGNILQAGAASASIDYINSAGAFVASSVGGGAF